jgi:hypothetical protein
MTFIHSLQDLAARAACTYSRSGVCAAIYNIPWCQGAFVDVLARLQERGLFAVLEVLDINLPRLVPRTHDQAASTAGLCFSPAIAAAVALMRAGGAARGRGQGLRHEQDIDLKGLLGLCRAPDRWAEGGWVTFCGSACRLSYPHLVNNHTAQFKKSGQVTGSCGWYLLL